MARTVRDAALLLEAMTGQDFTSGLDASSLRGKRIGMSLAESMEIIDMYDPRRGDAAQLDTLLARVAERRRALRAQLEDIEQMLRALDEVESLCRLARDGKQQRRQTSSAFSALLERTA